MVITKRFALLLLLSLQLCGLARAHEGEDHGDIRDQAPPPATAPSGPPRVVTRSVTANGKQYQLVFSQMPADPEPGQPVQIEVNVKQRLAEPDPLLGSEITVEGAHVSVQETRPEARSLGEAHGEATPGSYGIHFTPAHSGTWELVFQVAEHGDFPYELQIHRPLRQTVAFWVAGVSLGLALIVSVLRRRFLAAPWIVAGLCSGLAFGYGWWPRKTAATATSSTATAATTAADELRIPADLQRDLEIKVQRLEWSEFSSSLSVPGQVQVPSGGSHTVHARFTSRVLGMPPRVGQPVRQGDPLLTLEEVLSTADRTSLRAQDIDLKARQLDFATRQNELRRQRAELAARRQVASSQVNQRVVERRRSEQLYAIQAIPLKELQSARFAEQQARAELQGILRAEKIAAQAPQPPELPGPVGLQQYTLTAPIDGIISKVEAAPDEVVDPTKALVEIVDLERVWVVARVSERDLGNLRRLGRAQISTPAYPGPYVGRFVSTSPALDPQTRTAQVIFEVDNPRRELLDGMSADVRLPGIAERVLLVPTDALLTADGQSRVFVRVEEDRFEPRTVRAERTAQGKAILRSGVDPGAEVVVQGAGALASELARRDSGAAAPESPGPAPEHTHAEGEGADHHHD